MSALKKFMDLVGGYNQPPFNTGVVSLKDGASSLFYVSDTTTAGKIDFTHPTDVQLENLAKACQPATFGLNQMDILDEPYRKAGKLDAADFATQFTPASLGIIQPIYDHLLQGRTNPSARPIHVELYKLNVYGPGAFFKAHVDTPRSDTMFGSLVVVLPTVHEGGSLIFRRDGSEWTFKSAEEVKIDPAQAAFAMFFSDVEHEVSPVTSGYRVTLTYNLYFLKDTKTDPSIVIGDVTPDLALKDALGRLLEDKKFLPKGGALGFGLSHRYPFNPESTYAGDILQWLKGPDAGLKQLCEYFKLEVAVKAVYDEEGEACLLDDFYDFGDEQIEDGYVDYLINEAQAGKEILETKTGDEAKRGAIPMVWVKPLQKVNNFQSSYIYYGNEASVSVAYGEVCLVATVLPPKQRLQKI